MRQIIFALLLGISSALAVAQGGKPLELAAGAPDRYIVVPGDTLWSISSRFLKDPYRWGELWRMNPDEVKNPHKIYPGQVLALDRSGAYPRLGLETVKLRPHEYVESLKKPIASIPYQDIEPFLTEPLVIDAVDMSAYARVVAIQDNRVVAGAGDRIYATNVAKPERNWQVFRGNAPMLDPDTKEVLGYEAYFLGTARQIADGDPSTFVLTTSREEVTTGDHLLPAPRADIPTYVPRAPDKAIKGKIIGVRGGINFAGRNLVVSINRGSADGVEVGHVLAADTAGFTIEDRYKGERKDFSVSGKATGLMFVFRVFNRVAYALVLESSEPVKVGDIVHTP